MLLKRLIPLWKQFSSSRLVPSSDRSSRAHVVAGTVFLCCAAVGLGGSYGISLYKDYLRLIDENTYLHQRKMELDKVQVALRSILEDENTIRSFLGLRTDSSDEATRDQGGNHPSSLLPVAFQDPSADSVNPSSRQRHSGSVLNEARALQEKMKELVESIRKKRELINRVPSILPVDTDRYWFSSRFGWRRSPFTGRKEFHNGLDISAKSSTPITAPAKGRVIEKGYDANQGNYLRIDHGWGCVTTFAHLLSTAVSPAQDVERGDLIAFMGSTGRSTGPHLHYQIEINGKAVDPFNYIINAKNNPPMEFPLHMGAVSHEKNVSQ